MGLGKTIQALCAANELGVNKATVVCPASLRINWQREAAKWLTKAVPTIIGYEEVVNLGKRFDEPKRTQLLIVDEAQYCKSPTAQRTKSVLDIEADYRLFLSGTPIVNRPVELWPVLNSIDPAGWGDLHTYGMRYCKGFPEVKWVRIRGQKRRISEWNYKGADNLKELQYRLRSTIMVRRLKKDVLKDLPPKVRQVITFPKEYAHATDDCLAQVRRYSKALVQRHSEDVVRNLEDTKLSLLDKIAKVRHLQALAKTPAVVAHVRDVLESVQKAIVFAHHRDVITKIREGLEKQGISCVTVMGGTDDTAKQAAVDSFQDGEARVFLGQMEAAGVGLTLTAAHVVIFAELGWTPGGMTQCEDRAHRIGQLDSVLVQHLVMAGSLDALISKILTRKQKVLDAALDGEASDFSFDILETLGNVDTNGDTV